MAMASDSTNNMLLSLSAHLSSGNDVQFPERQIEFTRDQDTVSVGRSSKVSSKGYIASIDSAWFDSPVMSRMHARFCANMDDREIEIVDLGSLHGTFMNGDERLPANEPRKLKDGDLIRFGAPIWRGTQQFMPTTVKVGFPSPKPDGPNTFQVPEGSDDEVSEDEVSGTTSNMKQTDRYKTTGPTAKTPIIDLTDVHSNRQDRQVIDLSSPCNSPIQIVVDDDDEEVNGESNLTDNPDSENTGAETNTGDHATSPELGGGATIREPPKDRLYYDDDHDYGVGLSDSDELDYEYEDDQSIDNDVSDEDSHVDYPYEESDSELDATDAANDDHEIDDMSSMSADLSSEEDEVSDFKYDYWGVPIQDHAYPEIEPLVASLSQPQPISTFPPTDSSQTVARTATGCSIERLLNSDKSQFPVTASSYLQPSRMENPEPIFSPNVVPPYMRGEGMQGQSWDTAITTAEALGLKTGKPEFFLARAENKLALSAQRAASSRPTMSVQALCNADEPAEEPRSRGFGPAMQKPVDLPEEVKVLTSPADPFPPCSPLPLASPPAEKSCDPFVEGSGWSSGEDLPAPDQDASTGEETEAIREPTASAPIQGEKLKRKAEDISDTTEEQEQWAAKAAKALSPPPSEDNEEQPPESPEQHVEPVKVFVGSSESESELDSECEKATATPAPAPERPVKRARVMRVAERLGYAALGGVTAGAMIFGTLVYTAPTFT